MTAGKKSTDGGKGNFPRTRLIRRMLVKVCILLLFVWGTWRSADWLVLRNWDADDSRVVLIREILERRIESASGEEADGEWEVEKVLLRVTWRNGPEKGKTGDVETVQLAESRLALVPGGSYLLLSDTFENGTVQHSISDRYRIPSVAGIIALACGCLAAAAGWAGVKALAGLALSLLLLLGWYVPGVAAGLPPVPAALFAVAGVSLLTVAFVVRRRLFRPVAFFGAVGGAAAASLVGWAMGWLWQLTGLESDSAVLLASGSPGLSLTGVSLAAVIIGSIGAVLDVAVSVTSTMSEMFSYDPSIPVRRLWIAGVCVGKEVLGSMINTLILAYLGSSLPFAVLVALEGADIFALLNDPHIASELLRSIAGTAGLLLTIPVTASAGVWWIGFRTGSRRDWNSP